MRHIIIRFPSSFSSSSSKLFTSHLNKHQNFHLSSLSKSSNKSSKSNKTRKKELRSKDPPESNTIITSLFKDITEILGAEDVISDKTSPGFSSHIGSNEVCGQYKSCSQVVCGNAQESSMLQEPALEDVCLADVDVSPVVDEITTIVRDEIGVISMEERLESGGFRFDPEIVEKVLKRCFKVPHLAFRFFNWVKMRDGFFHTTKTYNTMLYITGEAKEFAVVEDLLEEMDRISCEKDAKTWTILISQFGKAKLISKALLIFEKMRTYGCEPDVQAYRVMIRSLCNAGKGEIALEVYKMMAQRDMGLDLSLYKMLLNCLAKLGDVAAVNLVADDMRRLVQVPECDVYVCMLKGFCAAGRIREALELIRDLKNKDKSIDHEYFETLLKGLCRANRIKDALEIFEIMKKKDFVDGKVYGIIINGYLRRKELNKALDLFHDMKESGYCPTTSTYTELMQHLFSVKEYQKGGELYDEMLGRDIETDSVTFMAVVGGLVRQNHIPEAWEVFKTMEDKGIKPTRKSYIVFIKELCKASKTDEILKVLHKMKASKIFIEDAMFDWIMSYMDKKGDMDNVKKVKEMQRIFKFRPPEDGEISNNDVPMKQELHIEARHNQDMQGRIDSHSVMTVPKTCSDQDMQEICRIVSSSADWCIMQEALEKCSVQFTPELVLGILYNCSVHTRSVLHFFSWVGKQNGYRHTAETYNMAMKISGRGKDFKHMRSLFYEMRRNGCLITSDTWTIMIMQYGRTGLTEIALKIFGDMRTNGCNPTISTYKCLIIFLCSRKGRKVDEAIKMFQEMIRAGHIPDKELVETYLCSLCEVGKLLEAKRCLRSLCKIGFTVPFAYSLYIRALCRAGWLEEALAAADEVQTERSELDRNTFASLVHGLLRKGHEQEALAKVESMKQSGILPTAHVYTSLIVHFFKQKQTEKALEIFQKMQQEGCEPTIVTYSAMIRGYMNVEKAEEAWNVFDRLKLKGPGPDFKMYSMFISCLCKAGKSEEALQLLSEMTDGGMVPSTVNFRTVFFGLNREGKSDLAQAVMRQKSALTSKRKFLT